MGLADSPEARELLELLYVDSGRLEFELCEQPRRHMQAAAQAAAARGQELLTKLTLARYEAEEDLKVRALETLPGKIKKTEDAIKHWVRTQAGWAALAEAHAHATVASEFYRDLVRAFEQRAWALRALRDAEDLKTRQARAEVGAEANAAAERVASAVRARLEPSHPNYDPRY